MDRLEKGLRAQGSGPSKPGVVFFGSGPVAAKSLELLAKNFSVEAVVTKPKPAHHRGSFPVLDVAEQLKLAVRTVSNRAELDSLMAEKPFSSSVGVLIDFGIIVSQKVIDYFPKGIINSHFSLLPQWRGADPITFSILSGQPKTGVSLMLIDVGMDTGKLIRQKSLDISANDTTTSLTKRLILLSNDLLAEDLPAYLSGSLKPRLQPHPSRATYSRKLTKEDGKIDWNKPAEQIEREIRAYEQWPKSYTVLAGKDVIITAAHVSKNRDENSLSLETGSDYLVIDKLKPAGKSEMTAAEFIRGYCKNL